jgi:hypothetical protein
MDQPPPIPESPAPAAPSEPTMSLAGRLVNVFAVPGEVFEDTRVSRPCAANWLVPALIACVVGIVAAIIMFSQPTIQQQLREQQEKAMKQEFDKQVAAGKMTQAQADQTIEMMEKFTGPTALKIFGTVMAIIISFVRLFWWGFVLWMLGRFALKAQFSFMKTVEISGLASMIAVLGAIVTLLLIVNFGKLTSTPSLALAVSDFDMKSKGHLLLSAVNVFTFWQVAVMSVGLARLAAVPWARAMFVVLAFWLVWTLVLVFAGLGQFVM